MGIAIRVLLVAGLLLALSTAGLADVVTGPVSNPGNGHFYYLLAADTWWESETEAISLGGHLVTVNDAAEQGWVYDTFSTYDSVNRDLWIGFHDSYTEGVWEWISGEAVTYTNWCPSGEPNAGFPTEDYAHMWSPSVTPPCTPGAWVDRRNDDGTTIYGVVETAASSVGETSWSRLKALYR